MRTPAALLVLASSLLVVPTALADATAQSLPYSQNWTNIGLITADDNWGGVPGIEGYSRTSAGATADPQTILVPSTTLDVIANQTSTGLATGGVAEFHITDPVVALQGSGGALAPNLIVTISTTGSTSIVVAYRLRHLDTDMATQRVALQYRVGTSGNFTNVPAGNVANAATGMGTFTAVSATLPAGADNQATVQVRIITADASGADAWIGVDDISITGTPISAEPVCGDGIVESPEECDGGACCSSFCQFEEPGTLCRDAADFECDVPELCTGTSAACPADALEPDGTLCGFPKGGPPLATCDAQDTCEAGFCVNRIEPAGTSCRSSTGICDPAEVCDGTTDVCPEDSYASSSVVCRAAAGACDAVERCDGFNPDCPGNAFLDGSNVCRPSAGVCDSAEQCTGVAAACPSDSVLAIGTLCRASTGTCDPAESCNGFATCPADRSAPDGTACGDGTTCDGAETCQMGSCRAGTPLSCDDRNACTADACAEPGGCQNNAIAGCCNIDGDCRDDGDLCTTERCSGTGGTCESLPITGCCTDDSDCTGGTACLAVSCNLGTNRCETTPVMGCCDADADCDDSVSCTRDTCNTTTGACSNTDIVGCCVGTADCDDGDDCTTDRCSSGTCAATAIDGCCLGDSDCTEGDGDACTAPRCNVATERCTETAISCDDADGCTADACEADGSCSHTDISCDDGDECTADACAAGACEHTDIVGCGMTGDAGMTDDAGVPVDDAGMMVGMDAALPDAGFTNDAASLRTDVPVDAGSISNVDAGLGTTDAGPLDIDESGCSCSVPGTRTTSRDHWLALGVIGLLVAGLRRRRR